jgi:hypothetical protein
MLQNIAQRRQVDKMAALARREIERWRFYL